MLASDHHVLCSCPWGPRAFLFRCQLTVAYPPFVSRLSLSNVWLYSRLTAINLAPSPPPPPPCVPFASPSPLSTSFLACCLFCDSSRHVSVAAVCWCVAYGTCRCLCAGSGGHAPAWASTSQWDRADTHRRAAHFRFFSCPLFLFAVVSPFSAADYPPYATHSFARCTPSWLSSAHLSTYTSITIYIYTCLRGMTFTAAHHAFVPSPLLCPPCDPPVTSTVSLSPFLLALPRHHSSFLVFATLLLTLLPTPVSSVCVSVHPLAAAFLPPPPTCRPLFTMGADPNGHRRGRRS